MEIRRSVLVPYAVEDMFDLIEQAENYPQFLPWCVSSTILERSDDWVAARIDFRYLQVRFGFQTRNPKKRPEWLKVRMVQGPFRHFNADWQLTPLDGHGCRVHFDLNYEVSDSLLDRVAAKAAELVARSMMDAFVKRAEQTLPTVAEKRARQAAAAPAEPVPAVVPAEPPPPAAAAVEPAPAAVAVEPQPPLPSPPPPPSPPVSLPPPPVAALAAAPVSVPPEASMIPIDPVLFESVRACPLADELDDEQARRLAALMQLQDWGEREIVAPEDRTDDHLYVVVSGELAAIKAFGSADEHVLVTLKPRDFAHELGFLAGAKRYASLVAQMPSRVLMLKRESLETLIATDPLILYRVMCSIVKTVHRIQTRLSVQASELTNYIVKQHGRY